MGDTGPIGPVAIFALLVLLALSPLMRGGNRHVAMVVLEGVALLFLVGALAGTWRGTRRPSLTHLLLLVLVTSPLWLALVYLLPVPLSWWRTTPGREMYPELLSFANVTIAGKLPLSLVPDVTAASLFAGIPLVATFVAGYCMRMRQLKLAMAVFVGVAFFEVAMGLAQVAGGAGSSLFFGRTPGQPVGTFANPNHFANYVALALCAYLWLAWMSLVEGERARFAQNRRGPGRGWVAFWASGAVLLLVGILMSRSRGAALSGLPAAICAFAVALTGGTRGRSGRVIVLGTALVVAAALALVGIEPVLARFKLHAVTQDASFRTLLASTTLEGAAQFWPWGTGWGTYAHVYPRFQPLSVAGLAEYAHDDYAQILFEGGIFGALLMAVFGILFFWRAIVLVRAAGRRRQLSAAEMASTLFGIGVFGFLLHSFVEFNMHIPANAIAAALLAGAYLRPLEPEEGASRD
jgi:O-antigen ligase